VRPCKSSSDRSAIRDIGDGAARKHPVDPIRSVRRIAYLFSALHLSERRIESGQIVSHRAARYSRLPCGERAANHNNSVKVGGDPQSHWPYKGRYPLPWTQERGSMIETIQNIGWAVVFSLVGGLIGMASCYWLRWSSHG